MRLYIIIITIVMSFSGYIHSQNGGLNRQKYWVWRDRLVNDFMVPGTCNGCGIVFNNRGTSYGFPYPPGPENGLWYRGGFDISDNGFEMGKYLIVLATEWKLLRNSGMSTSQTELEIFYELKTIDRLDHDAEKYWAQYWFGLPPDNNFGNTNGFLIRDDVFDNFLWYDQSPPQEFSMEAYYRYLYLNQGIEENVGKYVKQNILPAWEDDILQLSQWDEHVRSGDDDDNGYPDNKGYSAAEAGIHASDHTDLIEYGDHITGPEEYSHDNYIGLLQGLVTLFKLLDENLVVYNPDGSGDHLYLKEHTSEIIDRIIHYISGPYYSWDIWNPITMQCVKGVFWNEFLDGYQPWKNYCNMGGAEAQIYSEQFAYIHNKFSGTPYIYTPPIWIIGSDNLAAVLLTMSDFYHYGNANERAVNIIDNYDAAHQDIMDENQYLDLLYNILHKPYPNGDISIRGFEHYESILNTTSCCTEFNTDTLSKNIYDNLLTPMIIHNCLLLLKGETYQIPALYDPYQFYPTPYFFPPPASLLIILGADGTQNGQQPSVPYTIQSLEAAKILESTSEVGMLDMGQGIVYTGHVEYIAQERITLKPGFKVSNGAYFHAKIEESSCYVREGLYDFTDYTENIGNRSLSSDNSIYSMTKNNETKGTGSTLNLTAIDTLASISVFPNPCSGEFFIEIPFACNDYFSVSIFNSIGDVVYNQSYNRIESININISNQPSGFYYIVIFVSENEFHKKLIIK